jgi:hypothetical protein
VPCVKSRYFYQTLHSVKHTSPADHKTTLFVFRVNSWQNRRRRQCDGGDAFSAVS